MTRQSKTQQKLFSGESDYNFPFDDLLKILNYHGFEFRIKGSHHIYYHKDIEEIINLQPLHDNKAKPYQVKQVRNLLLKYRTIFK